MDFDKSLKKWFYTNNSSAVGSGARVPLLNANGEPIGSDTYANVAKGIIGDGANIGNGYGVCSTAANETAKTVTITNFALMKNMPVSIRFQKGISVNGATLNINSTGAKAIVLDGVALQADVIKENTTVTFVYDGTNFNIVSTTQGVSTSDELLVDLGLPSGLRWATRNIDVTQANGFAASPYQYECSFVSWGNTEMHNPKDTGSFDYDWGTSNDGVYASTAGAALTADAGLGYDAARVNLGAPWRLPTTSEYAELFNSSYTKYIDASGADIDSSTTNKLTTMYGVTGIRLKSLVNGKTIFFACSGHGNGASWYDRGSFGLYWSSSLYSATNGRNLLFNSGGVYPQNFGSRFDGVAVRAVQ